MCGLGYLVWTSACRVLASASARPTQSTSARARVFPYTFPHSRRCLQGLGKTAQTISFLGVLRTLTGNRSPHLVVCPASLIQV